MKREDEEKSSAISFTITEKSTAHMVAQIRAKQLATKSTQDKLIKAINYKLEEVQDTPGDKLIESIGNELEGWKTLVAECNTSFKKELLVEKLGFPIMYNKTFLQLDML